MTKGGKIALGALVIGGIGALVFFSGQGDAKAATQPNVLPPVPQPNPHAPQVQLPGGVVVVPPVATVPSDSEPAPNEPAPAVLPSVPSLPSLPGGSVQLPGALGLVQAKATLALWANSDGSSSVTLSDYGKNAADISAVWGPRDSVTLMAFQNWTNHVASGAAGRPVSILPNDGQPDAQTLAALQTWGVQHLGNLGLPPLAPTPSSSGGGTPVAPAVAPAPAAAAPALQLPPMVITAPPAAAQVPTQVAADTLQVVSKMLAQEASPHWRVIPEPTLKPWQQSRGLTADGDFGTGTALKMAQETGLLPIVRGWPRGSFKEGHWLPDYKAALLSLASQAPEPRASQLRAAAAREQGQGFGAHEAPIGQTISLS